MQVDRSSPAVLRSNAKQVDFHAAGILSSTELFENILAGTIAADESLWAQAIEIVPIAGRQEFLDFARAYLLSVDFMPPPGMMCPDPVEAKQRNRPRYIAMLRLIEQSCPRQVSEADRREWEPPPYEEPALSPELELELSIFIDQRDSDAAIRRMKEATGLPRAHCRKWVGDRMPRFWRAPIPPPIPCPYCDQMLTTGKAQQCFQCGMDWHNPQRPVRRGQSGTPLLRPKPSRGT